MPLARDSHAGFGVKTANGVVGGRTTPGPSPALTTGVNTFIEYNGSSWTEKANINQQRWLAEGAGVVTSGIIFSGSYPSSDNLLTNVETWYGTNWTEVSEINTARHSLGSSGNATDALVFSGRSYPPGINRTNTEAWNGSAWTEVADVATARYDSNAGGAPGSGTSAIMTGGYGTAYSAGTEEWTAADFEIKTVTTS